MSSFRDTFSKNEESEGTLNYDDTAFFFFGFSLLAVFVIPFTLRLLLNFFFPEKKYEACLFPKTDAKGNRYRYCKCTEEVEKMDRVKRKITSLKHRLSGRFFIKLGTLAVCWYLMFICSQMLTDVKDVKAFDPFEILQVSHDATDKEIKKAYRRLSLIYHPDKNPDDPKAQADFIQITKAYAALTDETAKLMYEKYGNPDGAQTMKVGIGLPKFILSEQNKVPVLFLFAFVMLFVVPSLFILHYFNTRDYSATGVMFDTLEFIGYYMNNEIKASEALEFVAASQEALILPVGSGDLQELREILGDEVAAQHKSQWDFPVIDRNMLLLVAHINRQHEKLSPALREVLEDLLKIAGLVTPSIIDIATMRDSKAAVQEMILFRQCLMQAIPFNAHNLQQVPHLTAEQVRSASVGIKGVPNMHAFLELSSAQRAQLAPLEADKALDVEEFCNHIPDLDLVVKCYVEDEKEVSESDILTIEITMTRKNLKEGEAAGPIYAPYYPEPIFENWWILVVLNGSESITIPSRVRDNSRVVTTKLQLQMSEAKKTAVTVHCLCDTYAGLDRSKETIVTVLPASAVDRNIFIHPKDKDLDNMPTLFEQVMGLEGEGADSSDDDDSPVQKKKKKVHCYPPMNNIIEERDSDSTSSESDDCDSDRD